MREKKKKKRELLPPTTLASLRENRQPLLLLLLQQHLGCRNKGRRGALRPWGRAAGGVLDLTAPQKGSKRNHRGKCLAYGRLRGAKPLGAAAEGEQDSSPHAGQRAHPAPQPLAPLLHL